MVCIKNDPQGVEILTDYCAGALDSIRAAELESHLRECTGCRELAEAQRLVWEALDAWKPVEVSSDFDARVYARIAVEHRTPFWRRLVANPLAPVTAAVAVLALVMAVRTTEMHAPAPQGSLPPSVSTERIDLQQVQQALDDLDLLTPVNQSSSAL